MNMQRPSTALAQALEVMFREMWRPPAIAVALCDSTGFVWSHCRGVRQIGSDVPVDDNTVFSLASGTKTMAVASIAHLCDAGSVGWDTRVCTIDPQFDAGDEVVTNQVTLRDLACHRAGWTTSEGRHRGAATSRADLVRKLRYHGFLHPFRSQFSYCTDAFSVLGHLVDRLSPLSWEQYATRHVLQPLGMSRTSFTVQAARSSANFATPHLRNQDNVHVPIPWRYEDGIATPAGGANSSLADLARWLGAWLSRPHSAPWSERQQRLMLEPQIANDGSLADREFSCAVPLGSAGLTDKSYALGWYHHRYRGESVYHHTGSIPGFRSIIAMFPERNLGFVSLTNADAVYLPRALCQATLDDLQGSDPMTWSHRFFEKESDWHLANSLRYRRTGSAHSRIPADLSGDFHDDGRFGRITIRPSSDGHVLEAGALRYRLQALDDHSCECIEPWGPLFINKGRLQFHRNPFGQITTLTFADGTFVRC